MKQQIRYLLFAFLIVFLTSSDGFSRPCDPTDPLGRNTGNLCPRFPASSINENTFIQGIGKPITTLPTVQQPTGRIIHSTNGFWTGVTTTNNTRTITDSEGSTYSLPNQNRMSR